MSVSGWIYAWNEISFITITRTGNTFDIVEKGELWDNFETLEDITKFFEVIYTKLEVSSDEIKLSSPVQIKDIK